MFTFGKHFASMYTGSMVGAGFGPYAVMGYVIANMQPDENRDFWVELNVDILATTFGEGSKVVQEAIDYLCAADAKSRTLVEEGKRLVKDGPFRYRVVNGKAYASIRDAEERRRQNREAQARYRGKKPFLRPGQTIRMKHQEIIKGEVEADRKRLAESPAFKGEAPPEGGEGEDILGGGEWNGEEGQ